MASNALSNGLAKLVDSGLIGELDRWLAELLAAEARVEQVDVAAAVALLGWARIQGHSALPLSALDQLPAWPAIADALGNAEAPVAERLLASGVVGTGGDPEHPLVIDDGWICWQRLWHYQDTVAGKLLTMADHQPAPLAQAVALDRLDEPQARAVTAALRQRLTIIVGGPGTGKTTVAVELVQQLLEQAAVPAHRIAIVAPTGKAAARLQQALHGLDEALPPAQTIHRLLRLRRGREPEFGPDYPLPIDAVLLDEASMVDLELMHLLLRALHGNARLVLLGDPHQLSAVGVGHILADLVRGRHQPSREVVELRHNYRFGETGGLAQLATAVIAGDADQAIEVLGRNDTALSWIRPNAGGSDGLLAEVLQMLPDQFLRLPPDPTAALAQAGRFRVLCAHRRGPLGARTVNVAIRQQLDVLDPAAIERVRFAGELLLVTGNDYELGVFNGDQAVVGAAAEGDLIAWFESADAPRGLPCRRLAQIETGWALTVHKSQGSEFDEVLLIAPESDSPLANRELLYTGITRARRRLTVVGDEAALRQAIAQRSSRWSLLGPMLSRA